MGSLCSSTGKESRLWGFREISALLSELEILSQAFWPAHPEFLTPTLSWPFNSRDGPNIWIQGSYDPQFTDRKLRQSKSLVSCPLVRSEWTWDLNRVFCRVPNPVQPLVLFISLRGTRFLTWCWGHGSSWLFCDRAPKASPGPWGGGWRPPLYAESHDLAFCWTPRALPSWAPGPRYGTEIGLGSSDVVWCSLGQFLIFWQFSQDTVPNNALGLPG